MKKSNLLIVIPAFNEEGNILRTLDSITKEASGADCVVIDDGSKDNTASLCRENGWSVISLPVNMGLSAAFRTGMKFADLAGYDYIMQIDGDGQHKCEYVYDMLSYAQENNVDILIGSRYKSNEAEKSLRRFGSKLINLFIRITTHKSLTDATSGMRLYNRKMIKLFSMNYNFYPEPDTIAYLIRCGARIDEYPVEMNERQNGESYLKPLKSIQYMFDVCVSILIMQWFRRKKGIL